MMNQTESFGVRLAQLRRDAGLSQQELAQALSVTRQAVSNWERDQTAPDLDMLLSIAAALGTADTPHRVLGAKSRKPRSTAARESDCPPGRTMSTAGVSVARARCAAEARSVAPDPSSTPS